MPAAFSAADGGMLDTLIRGGSIIDGTGAAARTADIGIADGMIVEMGRVSTPAHRVIDADGLAVTPGFVDIHTHYDGQALWDDTMRPSFGNGVTTAIFGNCGVGFAPLRPGTQDVLIDLMDGVEEIPGSVLAEGLDWDWTGFPDYLDRLEAKPRTLNVGALATHGPMRFYVMGDRIADNVPATEAEVGEIAGLLDAALDAGAWGLSSSRTEIHVSRAGKMTPDYDVEFRELRVLAERLGRRGAVFQFAPAGLVGENLDALKRDMTWFEQLAVETGAKVHLLVQQAFGYPDFYQEQLAAMARVAASGGLLMGQVHGRGVGMLLGLQNTNPFLTRPSYKAVMRLPAGERIARFADPDVRRAILAEADDWAPRDAIIGKFIYGAYAFSHAADFEPVPDNKLSRIAKREGRHIHEVAYDLMLRDGFVFAPGLNYVKGNLDAVYEMLVDPHCVIGGSDAGAHSLTVCDGALPSFMLSHWTRDREVGPKLPYETVVAMLTSRPARSIGMQDRGTLAPGMAADVNIIDLDALRLTSPRIVDDLPSGASRLLQGATGYRATLVNGTVVCEDDRDSGARPGKLLRRPSGQGRI